MAEIVVLDERRPKQPETREVLCEIVCYDNGDVSVWLADAIEDAEQFNWLFAKLAGASSAIFDAKRETTGLE